MARVMKVQKSEAIAHFQYEGRLIKDEPFGNGHINDTFLLTFELNKMGRMKAILQRMNNSIFEEPVQLMENILGVTDFLEWRPYIQSDAVVLKKALEEYKANPANSPLYDETRLPEKIWISFD